MRLENFAFSGQQVNFRECYTFCTGKEITEAFPKICQVCLVTLRNTYIAKKEGRSVPTSVVQQGPPLQTGLRAIRKILPTVQTPSTSAITVKKKLPTQQMGSTSVIMNSGLPVIGYKKNVFNPQQMTSTHSTMQGSLPNNKMSTSQIPLTTTVQVTQSEAIASIQHFDLAPTNNENVCLNCFKICNPTVLVNMRETRFNLNGRLINFLECYTFCTKRAFVESNTKLMICYTCLTLLINDYEQKQQPTLSTSAAVAEVKQEIKPTPQILDTINLDSSEDDTTTEAVKLEPENQYFTNFDTGQMMDQDNNTEVEIKIEPKIEDDLMSTYVSIVGQGNYTFFFFFPKNELLLIQIFFLLVSL
jgi:hypothetical protein